MKQEWPLDEIVEVTWGDSHLAPGWLANPDDEARAMKPLLTKSIGYLFRQTKEDIVLASVQNYGQIGNIDTIPMGMVKKVRRLK